MRLRFCCVLVLASLVLIGAQNHLRGLGSDNTSVTTSEENATLGERLKQGESDATWVLTSSFVVLTMQSGFGLLESGSIEEKFAVNIMMKNVADVLFGGLSYWMVGYGISYGETAYGILGTSNFFMLQRQDLQSMLSSSQAVIDQYSHYIFQFTFAATATTIVSGCVAGRMRFIVYVTFSFLNTAQYGFPAHWIFHEKGWLFELGFVDFAGDAPVHMLGGIAGAVGAWMVGPREGRFDKTRASEFELANPLNCIFGLFMLWWGWLGFNCGSTFGITGVKWLVATRVAVTTINASLAGGIFGMCVSAYCNKGKVKVEDTVNSILAALVSITAGCAAMSPASALLVGFVGAAVSLVTNKTLLYGCVLDDPVGAVGVHAAGGVWGLLSVGLFADASLIGSTKLNGLFLGGGFQLLGVQVLGIFSVLCWTMVTSLLMFGGLHLIFGLRVTPEGEAVGADLEEHGVETKQLSRLSLKDVSGSAGLPPEIEMLLRDEIRQWLAERLEHSCSKSAFCQDSEVVSGTSTFVVGVPSLPLPAFLHGSASAETPRAEVEIESGSATNEHGKPPRVHFERDCTAIANL